VAASISDIRLLLKIKSLPKSSTSRRVFICGGTGYIGSSLIPALVERDHRVRVLIRPGSKTRMPAGCEVVSGDALDSNTYRQLIRPADTFIHLVGSLHPLSTLSRAKPAEFRDIDIASVRGAASACAEHGLRHFIYLSVAHAAPILKDYVAARVECEQIISKRHLNATILRPWYVLGPGHRWPSALMPFYRVCEWIPYTRDAARRFGLVTIDELILALIEAVEAPAQGVRVVGVPEIRSAGIPAAPEVTRKTA
jgi:uncharacterized protein YbjT (DUF2867 family)